MASELKDKGNAAFQGQRYEEAIDLFTQAIALDASNHVLYSNRSASYAALNKFEEALVDAKECVKLKGDWARGYSRLATAYHGMNQYEEAVEAYTNGLKLDPANQSMQQGLIEARQAASRASASKGLASLFQNPDLISIIMQSEQLQPFVGQPDFMQMVQHLQRDPSSFALYQHDQRCSLLISELLMHQNPEMFRNLAEAQAKAEKKREEDDEKRRKEDEERRQKEEEARKPKLPENDEQIAALEDASQKCEAYKNKGTALYKSRKFDEAIKYYTLAYEAEDSNISCLTNRAAVHFEKGDLDAAEKDCRLAVERGREVRGDFKLIARAYERLGNIYFKRDDLTKAIAEYENAQMENRTEAVDKRLKELNKLKKDRDAAAYVDLDKSKHAKEEGNALVKDGKFIESIVKYDEAAKRNPKDHTIYSNRALVFLKLMEPQKALADCDKCLSLDPTFVRGHVRRGNANMMLKELTKAYDDFAHALDLDPSNDEAAQGLQRVQIAATTGPRDPMVTENALKDPNVQNILMDPVMKGILKDLSTDPMGVQRALQDPSIKAKMLKLIIAGIVATGPPPPGSAMQDDY